MTAGGYRLAPLVPQHERTAFRCGVEALDRYFHHQLGQDQRRRLAAPYVLADGAGRVAGYYTLSTFSIVPASLPASFTRRLPRYEAFPAIRIGRLAVDLQHRGRGFGEMLLPDAFRRSFEISRQIGAMVIVVDAKDESARSFYERFGFARFVDREYRLFLPMSAVSLLGLSDEP